MQRSYRVGMADGRSELEQVTVLDEAATATLRGECLPIVRVDRMPNCNLVVIWRNAPMLQQCDRADQLLGVRAGHSC
jgi:hypothetical protein